MKKILGIFLALNILFAISVATGEETLGGAGLSVSPPVSYLTLEKGAETKQVITLRNEDDEEVVVNLSLRPFRLDTAGSGAMIFPTSEDNFSSEMVGWTSLEKEKVVIPAKGEGKVEVSIRPPKDLGQKAIFRKHYLALVVSPEKVTASKGVAIRQELTPALIGQFQPNILAKGYYLAKTNPLWTVLLILLLAIIIVLFAKRKRAEKKFWEKPLE